MPTRVPARKASRRQAEHEGRIAAASTLKARVTALTDWIKSEFYRADGTDQARWFADLQAVARLMNKENAERRPQS